MFEPKLPASVGDIHLDQLEFWTCPAEERAGRVWSVEHGHWHDANGQQAP